MITLDTNVLARLLLADDVAQLAKVKTLLEKKQKFTAPTTVLLELVWVLQAHDCSTTEIEHALQLLLRLPNFYPANAPAIEQALTWYTQGLDFADALHLALSEESVQLMSFDKKFVKSAKACKTKLVVTHLPG